jgi:hypothetical protein
MTAESDRLAEADDSGVPWRAWGPYVAERAWGTVREDYSADGDAWASFPHDHARSRVYRWNEDGLGGFCDDQQRFCFAFSFWIGRDPILKERAFVLTNAQGNHGEDVKDYWWFLDATPTHSWMRWRYHYPQSRFPYEDLIAENGRRSRDQPEYELLDTGVFDGGYWAITVDYAKASPTDVCIRLTAENRGRSRATLHVLPSLWFRNVWSWGTPGAPEPVLRADGARLVGEHPTLGTLVLVGDGKGRPLLCDNETNSERLYGSPGRSVYPKDGINDHVVTGADTVNPLGVGTKGALHYRVTANAGNTATVRLRLALTETTPPLRGEWTRVLSLREREAHDYYAELTPADATADEALVLRQASAGLLWSKQFYHYDVERWLDGDPGQPAPPVQREHGRNIEWRHLNNHDVLSMPDTWEYPWYATWDLGFQCIALARLDPTFAKEQLLLLCREWYMHPSGQLPAYEWDFGDVNPPVHAWAALRVFEIDGSSDWHFLERVFHKLLVNFTWWVNRKDTEGNNLFEGGFLGLDNIGPFDRSSLPIAGRLEESDGTAWMARYCLDMLEMALLLARHDETYADVATKFLEHFAYISTAMQRQGLWDEQSGFFHDLLHLPDGREIPLPVRSMVGLLPLCAVLELDVETLEALPDFTDRLQWFLTNKPELCRGFSYDDGVAPDARERRLLSLVEPDQLRRLLAAVFDEAEFLSPHGLRSLSARHRDHPAVVDLDGLHATVDYEPAESRSGLFGGNSNWRGPVWFPLNHLLIHALDRFGRYLGDGETVELPAGSGRQVPFRVAAQELRDRLIGLFRNDATGRRPVFGDVALLQDDPGWHDLLPFHEYFHGDTGAGLGAAHQTGWTGLALPLLLEKYAGDTGSPDVTA